MTQTLIPKAAIVIAGPLFNLIFALLLAFLGYLYYGMPDYDVPPRAIVGNVVPDSPAEKAGLKRMDLVKSVNGQSGRRFQIILQKKL